MNENTKVIFSHPTGNANSKAALNGMLEAGLIGEFFTSLASFPGNLFDTLGAFAPFKEIRRRRFDETLQAITKISPYKELGRLISSRVGLSNLIKHEKGIFSIDSVYHHIDKIVARNIISSMNPKVKGVYAYEDGALHSFIAAKKVGLKTFYDLPIGYWGTARKLLGTEKERWPEWIPTLTGFKDSEGKLARKDEELRLANRIFVASSFTASTLQDYPGQLAPVEIIPYGFPPAAADKDYSYSSRRRLKILFIGGLSQRKGIADLFSVVKELHQYVELTIVGQKSVPNCTPLNLALNHHRWIPSLPHQEILEIMQEHDVLVFPSLFEGFGLVITEAMSQGTPVITTNRTAGPDLIQHGVNGWIIEAGSTALLKDEIEKILLHPGLIKEAGNNAMETARKRPWEVYGGELASAIIHQFKNE